MGNAQRKLCGVYKLVKADSHRLVFYDLGYFILNLGNSAAGVLVYVTHKKLNTASRIVKIGNGFKKRRGVKVGKHVLKFAECLSCRLELFEILTGVEGLGIGNELGNSPEALIVNKIVFAVL